MDEQTKAELEEIKASLKGEEASVTKGLAKVKKNEEKEAIGDTFDLSGIDLDFETAGGDDSQVSEKDTEEIDSHEDEEAEPESNLSEDEDVELESDLGEGEDLELDLDEGENLEPELDLDEGEDLEPELSLDEGEDLEPELSLDEGEDLDDDAIFDEEEETLTEEEKAMRKKKRKKIAWITLGVLVGTAAAVYLGFSVYFMNHFYFGTRINGTNFSAKDVSAVEEHMRGQVADYHLEMMESDNGMEIIQGSDIDLTYQEGDELDRLLKEQNPLLWITALWETPEITASVGVKYDENKLDKLLQELSCMKSENQVAPENAKPEFNGTEFVIKPETTGSTIDTEVFPKKVKEALDGFQEVLDLTEAECYVEPKFKEDAPEVAAACEAMNQYMGASITYTFGSATEVVDRNLISQWMLADENMAVTFNADAVRQYIQELAAKYDTYQKPRSFVSGNGNTVNVEGGDYGWQIDQEAEYQALVANIQNSEVVTKEPVYSKTAASHDGSDWGNSFVEVDLTNQMVYLFVNGALVVSGPVVTGKPSAGDATPQGVYSIKYCTRNATLRGPRRADGSYQWESPVSFWMPFNGGIGLHDAPWQAAFGGSRYLTHGSHGCVNLQYAVADTIYNNVSAGTPVVCHY